LNLGVVALEQGQHDLAREALSRFVAAAPPALFTEDLSRARRLLREISVRGDPGEQKGNGNR
jgi:hypothetical protein